MISRCRLTNRDRSHLYALKGITVCERWQRFENFLADMGEPPPGTSIDRKRGDRGYEPDNCRWATSREQRQNTADALWVEFEGRRAPLAVLAAEHGLKYHTVYARIKTHGWPIERALTVGRCQGRRRISPA